MRHRSIPQIIKYAKLSVQHNLTDIRFITPNALGYGASGNRPNISILEKLLKSIRIAIGKKGKIFFGTFPSEVRPDFVTKEALEIIKKYCDNDNIIIGAQSGSSKILKEIGRGHSVEDIYRAVKLTKETGFLPNVDFIFGLPGETKKDQKQTLKVIEDLIQMDAKIHSHYFMPLCGTPFENSKSIKIDKENYKILGRLESQGKLYGQWRKQELIAKGL
jgi:B12-binding domain/radical SAM domain protein